MKSIIRTSDRINFKSCRQAWDFGSKIRQNYEPISLPKPLDFGSAVHAGMEVIYEPKTWHLMAQPEVREVIRVASIQTFVETNRAALRKYEDARGPDELMRIDFAEREVLGKAMLHNYFDWIVQREEWNKFTPVYVEIEFEVPIPVPKDIVLLHGGFARGEDGHLYIDNMSCVPSEWSPVKYQGRIDSIWRDNLGRYWIVDHKTAGQFREDVISHLELDEQMKSYGWAIEQMLGIKVAGIIYNELFKGFPDKPKENVRPRAGRMFSVNKQIDTTHSIYKQTVMEEDREAYDQGLYDEFLDYLLNNGKQFFRRHQVTYSEYEYEQIGFQIGLEAIDMLNDPLIYANPSRFKCGYCMFRKPCLAKMDGSDVNFILRQLYTKRETKQSDSPFTNEPQEEVGIE